MAKVAPADAAPPVRRVLLAMSWYDQRAHQAVVQYAKQHHWHLDSRMAINRTIIWGWEGDGVICKLGCNGIHGELERFITGLNCPKVDLSVYGAACGLPAVEFDPDTLGKAAATHLLDRGLRHFAFFPDSPSQPIRLRREGFLAALAARGHHATLIPAPPPGQPDGWAGEETSLARSLASLPRPVGLMCFNDEHALQASHACERAGLRVPEDVAILGVDNQPLLCEALSTPLSSVAPDFTRYAHEACAMLDRAMGGETLPAITRWLPVTNVVTRRSTDLLVVDHPEVRRALVWITANLNRPMQVEDVVAATRMTRSGLKRAFATSLGHSIQAEIDRQRLERSQQLLRETDLKLEVIAHRCGLTSGRALHHLFARHGLSAPARWRRQAQGIEPMKPTPA